MTPNDVPTSDAAWPILPKLNRDMRFIGWFYIIYGALVSLSIVGALIGIPLLISGIRLRESADAFEVFGDGNSAEALLRGFERQQRFFFIQKVFIIIMIVFMVLYIALLFIVLSSGILGSGTDFIPVSDMR